MKRATRYLAVVLLASLFLGATSLLLAQAKESETDLYTAWYNEKDAAKKADVAKKYLEKFPNGQYASYMKQTVIGFKFQQFQTAAQTQNTADLFRIAKEFLAEKPEGIENITFLFWPAMESHRLTMKRDYQFAKDGRDFTQQAVTEIEGGKSPAMFQDKAKWESTEKNAYLARMYQNLGLIDAHDKATDQAVSEFQKALAFDPKQTYTAFQLGLLFQGRYDEDLKKYNAVADKESPEAKAQLDQLHKDADDTIDALGRFLALTEGQAQWSNQRNSVQAVLAEYWKTRHPDDPNGSQKAVDKYKMLAPTAPTPPGI
jgi:tetratricopeptide (TPR) repeat protein